MNGHEQSLRTEYFDWMCDFVSKNKQYNRCSYKRLLHYLHRAEFVYILSMDGNRFEDGVDLRYRFGYERNVDGPAIALYLDSRPCSILEMLIALSLRCEEHIMDNPDIGNRTGQWFWGMIENLGLLSMNDSRFEENYADEVIDRFLYRQYEPNGKGGLFTISDRSKDMRTTEIWYQMMWYLNEMPKE